MLVSPPGFLQCHFAQNHTGPSSASAALAFASGLSGLFKKKGAGLCISHFRSRGWAKHETAPCFATQMVQAQNVSSPGTQDARFESDGCPCFGSARFTQPATLSLGKAPGSASESRKRERGCWTLRTGLSVDFLLAPSPWLHLVFVGSLKLSLSS